MVLDQKEEWWWWPWGLGGRRGGGKEGRGERILAYDTGNRVSYDHDVYEQNITDERSVLLKIPQ